MSAKINIGCFKTNIAMFASQETQLAELVRELRFRLGLTQEQLAAELGVTFASINRWENRKVQPSPMALKLLRHRLEQMGDRGAAFNRPKWTPKVFVGAIAAGKKEI